VKITTRAGWAGLGLAAALLPVACNGNGHVGVIEASGYVEATEVRVATKVAGIVERLDVDEGDHVTKGQVLAQLDTTDTRLGLDAARGELELAAAELRLRKAGARKEDVAEAGAQLRRADAELTVAQRDLDRMEGLLQRGSGTTKNRDDARARRDVAAANRDAAQERLARLKAGFRKEEIDAAQARVTAAQARVAQLEQQIKDATIESPTDGVVTERIVEAGELASRGSVVVVVVDLADAWLTTYVSEADLSRIRLGQKVEVITDDGQTREGRLSFVSSKAEFTPKNVQTRDERVKLVYRLKVSLDNKDGLFKPGMPSEARLPVQGAEK
jgi:HlyD family secretion protein